MKSVKLNCIVTGIEKRVSPSSLNNKISKFGSLEMVQKFFVCKEACKLLKQGNTIDQVRSTLKTDFSKSVDLEVLFKLKLLKKNRKRTMTDEDVKARREQSEKNEREYYELQQKIQSCSKAYTEWATGGPNQCQVPYGGTCIRPDIYFNNEYSKEGRCRTCPYHEHCLCANKSLR